jgi:hypothetical protein
MDYKKYYLVIYYIIMFDCMKILAIACIIAVLVYILHTEKFAQLTGSTDNYDEAFEADSFVDEPYVQEEMYAEDQYAEPEAYAQEEQYIEPESYAQEEQYIEPESYVQEEQYEEPNNFSEYFEDAKQATQPIQTPTTPPAVQQSAYNASASIGGVPVNTSPSPVPTPFVESTKQADIPSPSPSPNISGVAAQGSIQYDASVKDLQDRQATSAGKGSFDPDMYNVENLLPKEKVSDWFEAIEAPISVKNRHLISVQQSVGLNTVGSSKRNATLDLRAAPPNPKIVVSPWGQSTIEPDYNTKPLC